MHAWCVIVYLWFNCYADPDPRDALIMQSSTLCVIVKAKCTDVLVEPRVVLVVANIVFSMRARMRTQLVYHDLVYYGFTLSSEAIFDITRFSNFDLGEIQKCIFKALFR